MSEQIKTFVFFSGVFAAGLLYYLDYKRRSAPEFYVQRRRVYDAEQLEGMCKKHNVDPNEVPKDPDEERQLPRNPNQSDVSVFSFKQIQLAEDAFLHDEVDIGARHLATAFVLSGEDEAFIAMMQCQLPGEAFRLTMLNMPQARSAVEKMLYAMPRTDPVIFP